MTMMNKKEVGPNGPAFFVSRETSYVSRYFLLAVIYILWYTYNMCKQIS